MNINIDSAIFIGFLAVNLVVGLWFSREVKDIKEYAIGNRDFSTPTIAATLVATWVSGSLFSLGLSETYTKGTLFIVVNIVGNIIPFIIIALFLAPRMSEFLGKLSVADAMGDLYGKEVRIITAISGIIGTAGYIAVQFKVNASIFHYFFGFPETYITIASALVVTMYSAFGGIKAVTITDLIQFITFGTMIPGLALIIWGTLSDPNLITNLFLFDPKFHYSSIFDYKAPPFLECMITFFYIMIPWMHPSIFQRITMACNTKQVSKSFLIAGLIGLFVSAIISWIGILLAAVDPDISPQNFLPYIIDNYSIVGLKGIIIAGITAMVMSTVDSYINSSSVLFAYDIAQHFKLNKNKLIKVSQVFSIFIGLLSLALALKYQNLISLILASASFYGPIVSVPLIMAILGFRSSTKSVLIGMAAGFIGVITWKIVLEKNTGLDSLLPGVMFNLVFLVGSHYALKQPGGWVGIKDKEPLLELKIARAKKIKTIAQSIKKVSLMQFLRKNCPEQESTYSYFSLFAIISVFSIMYSIPHNVRAEHVSMLDFINHSVLILATVFLGYPIWPLKLKNKSFTAILWNFAILYTSVFVVSILVIISNFGQLPLMIFILNLVALSIMLRWQIALLMMFVGVVISIEFYEWYTGYIGIANMMGSTSLQFQVIYSLLLVSSILIAFLKPKQEYIEATEVKVGTLETEVTHLGHEVSNLNEQVTHYSERIADQEKEIDRLGATAQKILNNVNHELRLPIGNVINFSDMLHEALQKSDNKHVKELSKEVYDNSNRVSTMILNMLDLATLDVKKVDLKKKTINFGELVENQVKICRKIYLRDKKINFELIIEPEVMIAVDPNYMRQTVDNLVINAINFSESGLIKVSVSKQRKQVVFTITDQGKGIPPLELDDIFIPFKMGSNTESKARGRGVGLALCKSAVEAHGGEIKAKSNGEVGAKFRFVLPI